MSELLQRALLYPRTIRTLTPRQWLYLPLRRLQRALPVRVDHESSAATRETAPLADALETIGPRDDLYIERADRILRGDFAFVGHELSVPEIDWTQRYVSHLWSYNLHYFDYAVDLAWAFRLTGEQRYVDRFLELTSSWIGSAKRPVDGWEPYPLATRTINWIYAVLLLGEALSVEQRDRLLASIHSQLGHLEKRIEWHLLANHLQRNLQALALGAILFSSRAADRWRRKWLPLLWRELHEQVLPDGGHYERSPMYHVVAAVNFLETAALARATGEHVPEAVEERMRGMVRATDVLSRPSGELHLFNDAAHGVAPSITYLKRLATFACGYSATQPAKLLELPDAGYFGYAPADTRDRLLIDCGEPGPRYQPGHAHNDVLSFELDVGGTPLIVDSGVAGYEGDRWREYVRSTRAHNTLSIGGREQHELWGTFRMARRATVARATQQVVGGRYEFHGSYTPYHARAARHSREVAYTDGQWTFTDRVDGAKGRGIESYLHFHPEAAVELLSTGAVIRRGETLADMTFFGFDDLRLTRGASEPIQGWHCPEFGRALPAVCLTGSIRSNAKQPFGYTIRERR